jgi:parallel beta-helix repeat protein
MEAEEEFQYPPPTAVFVDDDYNETTPGWGVDHFAAIQDGIDAVANHGTVYVYNGMYNTDLLVNKTITVQGENNQKTILTKESELLVVTIDADHVIFSGFKIINTCIYLDHTTAVLFSDNEVSEGLFTAISVEGGNNNTITNNHVWGNWGYGIRLSESNDNLVTANNVSDNSGISLYGANNNTITGNNVSGCRSLAGIFLRESNGNTITGNNASGNGGLGIRLEGSNDNMIMGNLVSGNNDVGVSLVGSSGNTFTSNDVLHNVEGIWLSDSNGNLVANNTIGDNYNIGIDLTGSSTIIADNHIFDSVLGIYLWYSRSSSLTGNTLEGNGVYIDGSEPADWSTNSIDTTNTVNGKPVYYLKNQTSGTVPLDAGQVILFGCTHMTVDHVELIDTSVGVQLAYSSDCLITNSTFSSMGDATTFICNGIICTTGSDNNIIADSVFTNSLDGIDIYGEGCTVTDCEFTDNAVGIAAYGADCTIAHSTFSNQCENIALYGANHATIAGNTMMNGLEGIFVSGTITSIIRDNTMMNNEYGIYVAGGSGNTISNNTITGNTKAGISVHGSTNTITGNTITDNLIGLYFRYSHSNTITENTIADNQNSIYMDLYSDGNFIYHNNFVRNTQAPYDINTNQWDNGYPDGGNYWDDFETVVGPAYDDFSGVTQINPGSDGIIDQGLPDGGLNPYPISGGSQRDSYPVTSPNGWVNNPPDTPSTPVGPRIVTTRRAYTYTTATTDPEGYPVYYNFSWGDGTFSGWLGPYASGATVNASHQWTRSGVFQVTVQAKDTRGATSPWSAALRVRVFDVAVGSSTAII